MTRLNEVEERPGEGWISITKAGMMLGVRYLKARDLASTGKLGEVKRTPSNRYFVEEEKVLEYREKRKARGIETD